MRTLLRAHLALLALLFFPIAAFGQGATKPPLKIGVLLPYTGPWAVLARDITRGMDLYMDKIGSRAGGREVQLLKEDTELKPDVALTKARKLVERDRVDVLTGTISSAVILAIRDYVHAQGIPIVVSIAGARQLTAPPNVSPWIFRIGETTDQPGYPFGSWVVKNTPYRKIAVTASDYAGGHQMAGAFMAAFKAAGGTIVKEIYIPLGTPDYAPYIAQIGGLGIDAVWSFFGGSDAIRFVKTFQEYGLKGKLSLIGHNATVEDYVLPSQGEAAVGAITVGHYSPALNTPESQSFVRDYQAKYNDWPPRNAENGYTSIQLITAAFELLKGEVDRPRFREALPTAAAKILPPRGPIRFDRYQQVILNEYVMKVERRGDRLVNAVIDKIPDVSQEDTWKWWNKLAVRLSPAARRSWAIAGAPERPDT